MSRLSSRIFLAPPLNCRNNGGTDRRTGLGGRRRFRWIGRPWFRLSACGFFILLCWPRVSRNVDRCQVRARTGDTLGAASRRDHKLRVLVFERGTVAC